MFRSFQKAARLVALSPMIGAPSRSIFGLGSIFKNLKAEYDHAMEPGEARHNPNTLEMSQTELFDEDAHELQAQVTNNTFDLEIMGGDVNPLKNFGTVDNPVLLFSANVGWRYVMCTGLNDEDEGLSHTGVWFLLREGPIHRCSSCGQCFKLVNLKDEISEENDYYVEHYMPILEEEMGDDDDLVTRFSFHKFAEPYPSLQPMQNNNYAYILVNPDDHDRILSDPAYRLQKLQEGHKTLSNYHQALFEVEEKSFWQRGGAYPKVNYSKADYEDLITSELAIRKLDRIYEKIQNFHKRSVLEPLDHERRENRMISRAIERNKNFNIANNVTNQELMYRDYYETDEDLEEDEQMAQQIDYEELATSGIFSFQNYNFVVEGTDYTVKDVESVFEQKLFKFKHRKWQQDLAAHFIRENRMTNRYIERLKNRDPDVEIDFSEVDIKSPEFAGKYVKYQNYIAEEAIQQYKDYYESDTEDLKDFDHITPEEKQQFMVAFKDLANPFGESKSFVSIPMREYDLSKGVIQNIKEHFVDLRKRVIPEVRKQIKKVAATDLQLVKASDVELVSGEYEEEYIEGFDDIFIDHQKEIEEKAKSPVLK